MAAGVETTWAVLASGGADRWGLDYYGGLGGRFCGELLQSAGRAQYMALPMPLVCPRAMAERTAYDLPQAWGGTAGVAYFAVHLRQRPDLPTPPAWPLDLERPARCSPLMVGIAGRAPTASGSRSGNPTAGVSTAIHEITNAASVTTDAGTGINCASLSSGGVACFALTDTGFVGKGITTYAAEGPVVPVGPTNAASVIAGPGTPARYLSQAVWTAGALLVMGWALDSTTTNSTTPGTRQGITNATSMSMGNDETTCVWLPPAE